MTTIADQKVKAALDQQNNKTDAEKKRDRYDEGRAFAIALLKSKPHLYWDQNVDRWFEFVNQQWVDYNPATMNREYLHALPSGEHQEGFRAELYNPAHDRRRKGQTFDFDVARCRERYPHLINRAVLDTWVQPTAGELHPAFDWLLDTLSSGRQAERDHIEQCIFWKHKHPHEYRMPALVLYGGAGNGKGILAEHILKNIFTVEHWGMVSGGAARLLKFQDSLAGKAHFVFDEANFRATEDFEFLKALIMKEDITIEPKGLKPYIAKMQTWFHIFNNSPLYSPVPATGTDVDRRFSFIRTSKVWWKTIAEQLQLGPVEDKSGSDNLDTKALALETLNNVLMPEVFTNRAALGAFVSYLYRKWDAQVQTCPIAFHGEDYQSLLENAQTTEDALFEDVFINDVDFLCISEQVLYDLYRTRAAKDGVKQQFFKAKAGLRAAANDFFTRKKLNIVHGKFQRYDRDGRRSPVQMYAIPQSERKGRQLVNTDSQYLVNDLTQRDWVPEHAEDREYNANFAGTELGKVANLASALGDKNGPQRMPKSFKMSA